MPDPGYDHTSLLNPLPAKYGGFIYANYTRVNATTFTLISIQQQLPGNSCLTFWYHLFGVDNVTFEVLANVNYTDKGGKAFWVKKLPSSNSWTEAKVNINMDKKYHLMFRARVEKNSHDTVAIDDVSFAPGRCEQTSMTTCDFEVKIISLKSSNTVCQICKLNLFYIAN